MVGRKAHGTDLAVDVARMSASQRGKKIADAKREALPMSLPSLILTLESPSTIPIRAWETGLSMVVRVHPRPLLPVSSPWLAMLQRSMAHTCIATARI